LFHGGEKLENIVDVEETKQLVEQAKREVRELKSLEMKSRWDLSREEKKSRQQKNLKAEIELRDWRKQQDDERLQLEEQTESENRAKDIADSRDYQIFKREVKIKSKEEDVKHARQVYETAKGHAAFEQEVKQNIVKERAAVVQERFETVEHVRDDRSKRHSEERNQLAKTRALERQQEILQQHKVLEKEKASLLESLKFFRDKQSEPIH